MKLEYAVDAFSRNDEIIRNLVVDVSDDQGRWRPSPEQWSIVEVINHLHDEEREDFRGRLDLLLHHPGEPWPLGDPEAWCVERGYNTRELRESVHRFSKERQQSIAWLGRLKDVDWDAAYEHERFGRIRAGDLLLSWLAHDFLHIRQLARLHLQYAQQLSAPFSSAYAGDW
jgi:hypothetical protein